MLILIIFSRNTYDTSVYIHSLVLVYYFYEHVRLLSTFAYIYDISLFEYTKIYIFIFKYYYGLFIRYNFEKLITI